MMSICCSLKCEEKIWVIKISKDKKIRKLVHAFQIKSAYSPPKRYDGSCLDGRDITYKIIPDANFKAKLLQADISNQIAKDLNNNYF